MVKRTFSKSLTMNNDNEQLKDTHKKRKSETVYLCQSQSPTKILQKAPLKNIDAISNSNFSNFQNGTSLTNMSPLQTKNKKENPNYALESGISNMIYSNVLPFVWGDLSRETGEIISNVSSCLDEEQKICLEFNLFFFLKRVKQNLKIGG